MATAVTQVIDTAGWQIVVPVKPNLHASGNTVMQEAALCGVPIVASDTG
ncbi:MAG: glycosyltransferase family 1 protein, partial [Actinomycetospora chiangmaiensis]|nr:glycosyltransferase family 1 protein [Actinomycetospora chiangmaiensis]